MMNRVVTCAGGRFRMNMARIFVDPVDYRMINTSKTERAAQRATLGKCLSILLAGVGSLTAQTPAANIPPQNLMPLMQEIVQALGVQCEYCHSAPRGSGQPEPKKDVARQMIAMT